MDKKILLNDFATRSFRDTGDYDYIAARMAYRCGLASQFLWSAQQAIEKYLKCILLLNRIQAVKIKHDLSAALTLVEKSAPFELRLSEASRELIEHVDRYGRFRYLEVPYHLRGVELPQLDQAVWEVRRYCKVLDYRVTVGADKKIHMLELELKKIEESEKHPPQKFRCEGALGSILDRRDHPARRELVYKNLYFGTRPREQCELRTLHYFANSPLSLHPEILDDVSKYVFLPGDVKEAYRRELQKRETRDRRS